jgi:hypothetical protein
VAGVAARGRGAALRWAAVGALVAVLVALPAVLRVLPASESAVPATDLRDALRASADVGFSGYAVSAGGLSLPVSDELPTVADLFSDRTAMRAWWRGPDDSRVDVLAPAGETGTRRDAGGTWTWEYESATVVRTRSAPLALPAAADLLPSTLGRRLLSEAPDEELSRLGARRVAGRDAQGLRLTPAAAASSVRRVDVWVDAATGLALQVQVFGKDGGGPALDTRFLDLEVGMPDASVTRFVPPEGAAVREGREADVVQEAGRRLRQVELPAELAGLPRRALAGVPAGIGLYGSGVTLLTVAPVPSRLAGGLRAALNRSPDAVADPLGTRVAAGPVGVMLVEPPGDGPYVLTGTVTLDALADAASQLPDLVGRR